MSASGAYRWRKTTDINREHALFELMDGEVALFDVGFSDHGKPEITFNPGICGKTLGLREFADLLEEGKTLAERDL